MRVVVAMSGGVDSSVAAGLLARAGHEAIGVTLQIWSNNKGNPTGSGCCSLGAVEDARRVAAKLGIPHYVLNFRDLFANTVVRDFTKQYLAGRTPNPCVRCNQWVKFDALMRRAVALGADALATGHYARIQRDEATGRWLLLRGADRSKDQSYALYMLTQQQLSRTIFPLGGLCKQETRRLADEMGLPVANKPDSQEICFVSHSYREYIEGAVPEARRPGPVLNRAGEEIGTHRGIAFYTVGQRKGLGVASRKPLYVTEVRPEENAIVVGDAEDLYASRLTAAEFNWILAAPDLQESMAVTAKVRYNMPDAPAVARPMANGAVEVVFEQPQRAITPGQAVVCYAGEYVVGGGTIESVTKAQAAKPKEGTP